MQHKFLIFKNCKNFDKIMFRIDQLCYLGWFDQINHSFDEAWGL